MIEREEPRVSQLRLFRLTADPTVLNWRKCSRPTSDPTAQAGPLVTTPFRKDDFTRRP